MLAKTQLCPGLRLEWTPLRSGSSRLQSVAKPTVKMGRPRVQTLVNVTEILIRGSSSTRVRPETNEEGTLEWSISTKVSHAKKVAQDNVIGLENCKGSG
jgi:hypothetical protein